MARSILQRSAARRGDRDRQAPRVGCLARGARLRRLRDVARDGDAAARSGRPVADGAQHRRFVGRGRRARPRPRPAGSASPPRGARGARQRRQGLDSPLREGASPARTTSTNSFGGRCARQRRSGSKTPSSATREGARRPTAARSSSWSWPAGTSCRSTRACAPRSAPRRASSISPPSTSSMPCSPGPSRRPTTGCSCT